MTFRGFPMLLVVAACSPYNQQRGEFNAGPVDAANFPLAYRGVGGETSVNGYRAGAGTFTEIRAFINGSSAGYYSFPFTDRQLMLADLSDGGTPATNVYPDKDAKANIAYAFDPAYPNPFPSSQICTPPPNYTYDLRTDDMPLNEQDNIFIQLPFAREQPGIASTFEYTPVVTEVAVSAAGLACQSIKSEKKLKKVLGSPRPKDPPNLLLWAIIDPSSGVYRVGEESTRLLPDAGLNPNYTYGNTVQKWGWFGQYYLAYMDGAYIPWDPVEDRYGVPPTVHTVPRMRTQKLYVPRALITSDAVQCSGATCTPGQVCAGTPPTCQTCQSSGARACPRNFQCGTSAPVTGLCSANAQIGAGYDVLQYRRSDPSYTPVCQVWLYTAPTIGTRPRSPSELPRSVADIDALGVAAAQAKSTGPPVGSTPRPGDPPPRYIYCPQVD